MGAQKEPKSGEEETDTKTRRRKIAVLRKRLGSKK